MNGNVVAIAVLVVCGLAGLGLVQLGEMVGRTVKVLKAPPPPRRIEYVIAPADFDFGQLVVVKTRCEQEGKAGRIERIVFRRWEFEGRSVGYLHGYMLDVAPGHWFAADCLRPVSHQPADQTFAEILGEARGGDNVQGA